MILAIVPPLGNMPRTLDDFPVVPPAVVDLGLTLRVKISCPFLTSEVGEGM